MLKINRPVVNQSKKKKAATFLCTRTYYFFLILFLDYVCVLHKIFFAQSFNSKGHHGNYNQVMLCVLWKTRNFPVKRKLHIRQQPILSWVGNIIRGEMSMEVRNGKYYGGAAVIFQRVLWVVIPLKFYARNSSTYKTWVQFMGMQLRFAN